MNLFLSLVPLLRYEYSNKGADLYLEALARLNHYLKSSKSKMTVVAFLIFPTRTNSFNVDSLKGQAITKSLRYVPALPRMQIYSWSRDYCYIWFNSYPKLLNSSRWRDSRSAKPTIKICRAHWVCILNSFTLPSLLLFADLPFLTF